MTLLAPERRHHRRPPLDGLRGYRDSDRAAKLVAMRLVGFTVGLFLLVCSAPAAAQLQFYRPGVANLAEMERPLILVDARSLRRKLDLARTQYKNSCRLRLLRRVQKRCRSMRERISRLERQLSAARGARSGGEGRGRARGPARNSRGTFSRGSFRTICVRTCDGYYYSLSHTSSRRRFKQDAEKCKGQYPPGEAVLFYHPFPSDDVSRARSLDGEHYADQEYAFAFREAYTPHCAAQLHKGLAALKARVFAAVPTLGEQSEASVDNATSIDFVPIPFARQDWSTDPETLANRSGGLVPKRVKPSSVAAMRIVGDPYYFAEANPGPPPTVPGYVPPEPKDFRVKQHASALEPTRSTVGQHRNTPSSQF